MEKTQFEDESGELWIAYHNSDFSGEIIIDPPNEEYLQENEARIPFELMKFLVGEQLKDKLLHETAQMDGIEFLDSIGR